MSGCEWGALCGQPKITYGTHSTASVPRTFASCRNTGTQEVYRQRFEGGGEEEDEEWIPQGNGILKNVGSDHDVNGME